MKFKTQITALVTIISIAASVATLFGIYSDYGDGPYMHKTIRGETVEVYGIGLYRDMSADSAIQGIAQDYVTLFIGIPFLLLGVFLYRKGKGYAKFLLSGSLLYFFLTYLFYITLAMYNELFLVYVVLLACSLFALLLSLLSFDYKVVLIKSDVKLRVAAWFLLSVIVLMVLLWLQLILPPLLDQSLYPDELQHYTTLIVQALDLGIFLPLGFVSAILALRGSNFGKICTIVYLVFLFLLMAALTAKLVFMWHIGTNVFPALYIMPTIGILSGLAAFQVIKHTTKVPSE